jgi:acetoin utilization deacetylase AcuC-like enzyme
LRRALQRVAIVDFDIHHGNGTEDIVRNLRPRRVALPLPASWAPQLETVYKPWLNERDHENVFFGSVHLFDGDSFYPCSGAATTPTAAAAAAAASGSAGAVLIPLPAQGAHATPNIVNVPMPFVGSINPAARRKVSFYLPLHFTRIMLTI